MRRMSLGALGAVGLLALAGCGTGAASLPDGGSNGADAGNRADAGGNVDAGGSTDAGPIPTVTSPTPLPNGFAAIAYAQTLTAAGGTPPYVFTVAAGALPSGLSLDPSGALSGTPLGAGAASFTVQVADSANASSTKALALTVLHDVDLNWSASATSGVTYTVYRASGGGAYTAIATALNATLYTDQSVTSGTTYSYQVTAVDGAGESLPSNAVTAVIP